MVPIGGLAVAGILALSGCGAAGDGTQGSSDDDASGNPVTVTDSTGKVELPDGPAENVVSLEWSYTEDLIALGVTPAGIADIEGYGQYVTATDVPEGSVDVGTRQEPSMELIRAQDPDLIITDTSRSKGNLEQLQDIAPTLVFDPVPEDKTKLEEMEETFTTIAKATGRQQRASAVLDDLDQRIQQAKQNLADANADQTPVAVAQAFTLENAPTLRMFTSESFVGELIDQVGLRNGWEGKPDEWGFTTVGVEALTAVPDDARFLHISAEDDNIFTGPLKKNKVWNGLEFVRQDRVTALDPGTWPFGGPKSAELVVDELEKALT